METGRREIENWSSRAYQLSAVSVIFCRQEMKNAWVSSRMDMLKRQDFLPRR